MCLVVPAVDYIVCSSSLPAKAVRPGPWPPAEAGVAGQHHVRHLRRNSAGDEESQSVPSAVRKGGRQQEPGEGITGEEEVIKGQTLLSKWGQFLDNGNFNLKAPEAKHPAAETKASSSGHPADSQSSTVSPVTWLMINSSVFFCFLWALIMNCSTGTIF